MNWTDERVEKLTKLWADGLSASQIAAQLGGVTRNAVIGKVHRLNLPGRTKTGGGSAPRPKRQQTAARPSSSFNSRPVPRAVSRSGSAAALSVESEAVEQMEEARDVVVPIARRLTLVELTERTCKWPVGDPLHDDFYFCGSESGDSTPYCRYHARLAFQPSAERKRTR